MYIVTIYSKVNSFYSYYYHMKKFTSNNRICVVPSDVVRWLENNSDQLASILSGESQISNNICDISPFTLWEEVEKHRSNTNSLVMDKASEGSLWFRQSIADLLKRLNPQNQELINFMFYDEAGSIITEKIILALNNNTVLSDLDREYIWENCIEIFNNTENNPIFSIKLYHDNITKHIIAKQWWFPTMVFDKIDTINDDETVIPISGDLGVFGKDCEIINI